MPKTFFPVSMPSISNLEKKYVIDAVESGWISSLGHYVERFESDFADFCQTEFAVAVSNGTVAIHLALKSLGISQGDEVIVPDLSFIATANAVIHAGATPVFIDIDPFSLCLDPQKIEAVISQHTKAIMPVHLYGHPADMISINAIAEKHGLHVIEDAAEAHGSEISGKRVGGFGKCATFSFYGNKNFTTGEGGMITTNDGNLYEKLVFLRDHAMSKSKRFWHTEIGYNYRITNIQAALGVAQIERSDELLSKRQMIFKTYQNQLDGIKGISLNRTYPWAKNSYWLVNMEVEGWTEEKRDDFIEKIKIKGVDSRPYFYPMSDMPMYKKAETPISHYVYQKGISLPTYYDLSPTHIHQICDIIVECLS